MALTVVEHQPFPIEEPEVFKPPPKVAITPCDPWPRPYFLKEGLRRVEPYHYTYNTYVKERWRGREILEVFATEFRDRPIEYYRGAIIDGRVTINGKIAEPNTVLKNGDVIAHTLHRHEPPVSAQPIGIVHEDDDIIVINKPAGIPVHPAGRYNFNSVVELMRHDRGLGWNPMPCNRLDRLTSGIMFVGKHAKAADAMGVQIKQRTVKKEYIARVIGEFPEGEVICEQPILSISPKLGLNRVRADGKEARTVFKRLAYYPPKDEEPESSNAITDDGKPWRRLRGYSIVKCMPLTGRTHQLRVHLQFLGHPIANDPIYCNQRVFGPNLGKGSSTGSEDEDIISRLSRMGKEDVAEAVAYHDEIVDEYNKRKAEKQTGRVCDICGTSLYSDPGAHELGIYLHAKKYACEEGKWSYEAPMPDWALPPPGYASQTAETVVTGLLDNMEKVSLEDAGF